MNAKLEETKVDLGRLCELEKAATSAPWHVEYSDPDSPEYIFAGDRMVFQVRGNGSDEPQTENAELVVAMRNQLPVLIDELERLRQVVGKAIELEAAVKDFERLLLRQDKPTSLGVATDVVIEKRAALFKALGSHKAK